MRSVAAGLTVVLALAAASAGAQTVPRTRDGHPDFNGIWQALNTAVWNLQDHGATLGMPAGQGVVVGGEIPYLPSALAKRQANYNNRLTDDPEAKCDMVGVPRITYMPYPFQIVQTPTHFTLMYQYVHTVRSIYVDSRIRRDRSTGGWATARALGSRHAGHRRRSLHRSDPVRSSRQFSQRSAACRRALHPDNPGSHSSTKRPSKTRTCSRAHGRSRCRCIGGKNRTSVAGLRMLRVSRKR